MRNEKKSAIGEAVGGKVQRYVFIFTAFLGLVFAANSALAFRLSPASIEKEIKRGAKQTIVLNIANSAANPIRCRLYATGLEVKRDGKQVFEGAAAEYSTVDWLKPKESEFEIPAGGTKEMEVEISVPKNAQAGEYFAVIMAESTVPARGKTPQGVEISIGVNYRLGCITRITVPGGTVTKRAEISEVKVEIPSPESETQDIKVTATLENKCQVHLDAEGTVQIRNLKGRVFDKFVLQAAGKDVKGEAFIYPEGMRDFSGTIERPLLPGEYVAEVSFDYGYRFRRIRAETTFIVKEELSEKQKEFLTLSAQPNLLTLEMSAGTFRTQTIKLSNLDFEPLEIKVKSQAEWLKVNPDQLTIRPNNSRTLRIEVFVPAGEPVERIGKVLLTPARGKPVSVDVVVSEYKRKETKE